MADTMKVYSTTNYGRFKFIKGNREISKGRIRKLSESIREVGRIIIPVIVNEDMEVIDGQGRVMAAKELGVPVPYIIVKGTGIEECIESNRTQTGWALMNYINSYADRGNVSYQRLRTLIRNSRIKPTYIIPLAFRENATKSGKMDKTIKEGKLMLSKADAERAKWEADYLEKFVDIAKQIGGRKEHFMAALAYAYRQLTTQERNRLEEVIKKNVAFIPPLSAIDANLKVFDELYNKGLRKDNRINLEISYRVETV